MKQRETLTNEQARERIAMDCSCDEHVGKPQTDVLSMPCCLLFVVDACVAQNYAVIASTNKAM